MAIAKLSEADVHTALASLPGWSLREGKLHREYRFVDFIEAFSFMTAAALNAQARDHHPEWFNVYGTVRVDLTTHDAGGISARDTELAAVFESLASARKQRG